MHTFPSPDPNDEVRGEESDLLSDFPLEGGVGRLPISGSRPSPRPTLAPAAHLTRHHSSLESSMTVIFSPGLGQEGGERSVIYMHTPVPGGAAGVAAEQKPRAPALFHFHRERISYSSVLPTLPPPWRASHGKSRSSFSKALNR